MVTDKVWQGKLKGRGMWTLEWRTAEKGGSIPMEPWRVWSYGSPSNDEEWEAKESWRHTHAPKRLIESLYRRIYSASHPRLHTHSIFHRDMSPLVGKIWGHFSQNNCKFRETIILVLLFRYTSAWSQPTHPTTLKPSPPVDKPWSKSHQWNHVLTYD